MKGLRVRVIAVRTEFVKALTDDLRNVFVPDKRFEPRHLWNRIEHGDYLICDVFEHPKGLRARHARPA